MVVLCRFGDFVCFIHYEAHVRHCRVTETQSVCTLVTLEGDRYYGNSWDILEVKSGCLRVNVFVFPWESTVDLITIVFLFSKMSRTQSFTSTDKEKNPPTPRSKIGHRRVDETGETTYKKASVKYFYIKYIQLDMHIAGEEIVCGMDSYCLFWVKVIWSDTHKGHLKKWQNIEMKKKKRRSNSFFQNLRQIFIWVLKNTLWFVRKDHTKFLDAS